jgi:hypothetical protein
MIEAAIPGKYIFHTGEECGGLGSRSLAAHHPKLFKNIERAIAFDRANYGDVISFQRGSRCCSTEFGEAFAEALNTTMPPKQQFKSEVQGTFTDTASYMELVPECTNISVGYFDQHGANERFDYIWLKNFLLPQILSIDYEKLPTKRDPSKKEYKQSYTNSWNNIHVATKRKSWAEATSNTPFLEFPEWEPKLGYIEEAEPAVLKSAIGRFISINFYGPKKEEFVDWLFNLLEEKDIMQDHIKSLVNTLDKLRGEDNRVKLPSLPKEADIPFYLRHYPIKINTAREVLLTKLIIASQSEHIVLYGPYKQWLKDYTDGAKNFLKKNKEPYTKKQIEKFNRVMFSILTLLDSSEVHTKELEELLVEADNFITTNCHEEGFEVTEKLTKQLQEEAVIKLARMN